MIIIRKSEERRRGGDEKQKTWMTFDSENQDDPLKSGFGVLTILNEDILSPGSGFTLHTHKDMVIITYVQDGVIIYKNQLGKPALMESKEFYQGNSPADSKQVAFNVSQSEDAHVFQAGISKEECAVDTPSADTQPDDFKKLFTHAERQGTLKLIASADGRDSSLTLQQDVRIYSTFLHNGNHMVHELGPGRKAWLHVVKGGIRLNDLHLQTGDGAGLSEENSIAFTAEKPSEILLFDLCGSIPEEIQPEKTKMKSKIELEKVETH